MSSRIPGFFRMNLEERRAALGIPEGENIGHLPIELAQEMIENVIGVYGLPLGVVTNVRLNGEDRLVPVAVEEPSVVAAASFASRLMRDGGGFVGEAEDPVMIAQIQLDGVEQPEAAKERILAQEPELMRLADQTIPSIVARGGGSRGLEVRDLGDGRLVVHLHIDCRDAMGANLVNEVAERLGDHIAMLAGGRLGLRILSNLADRRRVRVSGQIPVASLADGDEGEEVAHRITCANDFADSDPYRAATHNKGIMNGVDAVLLACGQDWRGIEAGAHAYAVRDGAYRSLTRWELRGGVLHGCLELPMATATAGGATRLHPGAKRCLELLGVQSARDLGMIAAAVGLANNLAALRALVCEGIQQGHMRLHSRGVRAAEVRHIAGERA